MTKGFNEWNKYNLGYTGKEAYEAGAASRQAEIDDSENTRAVLYRENMDLRESNIELQNRIDKACLIMEDARDNKKLIAMSDVHAILRGVTKPE